MNGPGDGFLDIDPVAHAHFLARLAPFMAERAPYQPGALLLLSCMGADVLAATSIAEQFKWTPAQFETAMMRYWKTDGIDGNERIDTSGGGAVDTLRILAFEAAIQFARFATIATPFDA